MDADYILPRLKELCKFCFFGIPYAYVNERGMYVFGTKDDNGIIRYRNIVTKGIAIHLIIGKYTKVDEYEKIEYNGKTTTDSSKANQPKELEKRRSEQGSSSSARTRKRSSR